MALLRAGLVVSIMFILLVVASPVSVLGGTTAQDGDTIISSLLLRGSDSAGTTVEMGSLGHINRGSFSGRKMLAAAPPTEPQAADTQPTSPAPPAPPARFATRFATRFAFVFRSLAKGSSPPATGTPSPGHN